jgi:hypothetical protein
VRLADPLAPIRYLDVIVVVLAAPFVLLLGAPVLGYVVGAAVWIVQRVLEAVLDARASRAEVRAAMGYRMTSLLVRTWMVGIAIVAVGLAGDRKDGFTAAVLCLGAYTVHLLTSLLLRPIDRNANRA